MNENEIQPKEWARLDYDTSGLDELEAKLKADLEEQMADLNGLELDREKIGSPDSIGETIMNVVMEQVNNQIAAVAGEDFVKENGGLPLSLRDSAHIQTVDDFKEGKIAEHNYISREQLKNNYKRYKNTPHSVFRNKYVNPGMNKALKRAGKLHDNGIETVTDIYTGRQIPTKTKLEDGSNNPKAAQREHVKASAEVYQNPSLQMANDNEQLAAVINDPNNLQGYTTAERNNRKSDNSPNEMEDKDKNKHWEKANRKAEDFIKKKEKEGEQRLKEEGQATQKEEYFRIRGKALRAFIMSLLAAFLKDVIQKLIAWFRAGNQKIKTFVDSLEEAVKSFVSNLKQNLYNASETLLTTIATAIFGSIVGTIKKAWMLLKQGYRSVKQAIDFLKNPANKDMPFSIKLLNVGKIVTTGLAAGGTILLSQVIEKSLMTIPVFAFEIPLLGSLASLIGGFSGALVCGLIGALALNMIDRMIAERMRIENDNQRHAKRNEIIQTQERRIVVAGVRVAESKVNTESNVAERHADAVERFKNSQNAVERNSKESDLIHDSINKKNDDISNMLDNF